MTAIRHIALRHFRLLIALVETGSREGASQRLCLSASAVSKSLRELEGLAGESLLASHDGRLVPTGKGALLLATARRIEDELAALEIDFTRTHRVLADTVSIGYATAALRPFLQRLMLDIKKHYPNVTISAYRGRRETLLQHLGAHLIDIFVGHLGCLPPSAALERLEIYHDYMVIFAHPQDPITTEQMYDWGYLGTRPWLLPSPGLVNSVYFHNYLSEIGQAIPLDVIETDGLFFERGEIDLGRLMLTTDGAARAFGMDQRFRRLAIPLPGFHAATGLAWHKPTRPATQAVIDHAVHLLHHDSR
ncbi:LysR family transcriptional regulator [Komagataeibacter sp. AV436]|uniref:LysR family transcriptional regulator n=1 Tax=Komagataeibacter melomenusus TaxID=2766578 RepID=A0ABX2AC75_9PROT|nr:LysR family transcriptional regulator [Komagataeibacter melomenusus]MBV1829240.1 LysR family transcriptional regulator [Komagataeibacter melomenusus]NPC65421.1 LysR family transcriptional regulator [Komagataeibacter melomenusus]